jgi:hypothetical protein
LTKVPHTQTVVDSGALRIVQADIAAAAAGVTEGTSEAATEGGVWALCADTAYEPIVDDGQLLL